MHRIVVATPVYLCPSRTQAKSKRRVPRVAGVLSSSRACECACAVIIHRNPASDRCLLSLSTAAIPAGREFFTVHVHAD
eukprot:6320310-Pyramimonas_sp.AAC.2